MTKISNLIIPILVLVIIIHGFYKKVNIFDSFLNGVKEGLNITLSLFPTIFAMILAINILVKSTFLVDISNLLAPLCNIINFPSDILPLALLRPVSGSSSLLYLNNILTTHGPDTYLGILASIIQGGTDTTIYIIGLYYGSIGIKKIRHSLWVGLITDLICVILSFILVTYIN